MSKRYRRVIWWIKRDIRLHDNGALSWAVANGTDVLPLYIVEPSVVHHASWSGFHSQAVGEALEALRAQCRALGADMVVAHNEALPLFKRLHERSGFDAIVAHEETGPLHTYARDRAVRAWCADIGLPFLEVPFNGVIRRLTTRGDRMEIWRERMHTPTLDAPDHIPQSEESQTLCKKEQQLHTLAPDAGGCTGRLEQKVSEAAAHQTLHSFLTDRSTAYKKNISAVEQAAESCSRISIHLAWGTISMRQVSQALEARREELSTMEKDDARPFRSNLSAFRSRLFWHDHFCQRLEDEPDMELTPLNRAFESLPYVRGKEASERLKAWITGRTGFPMVDACMRRFAATGWLNFRMRAMVVSCACHLLHLDWRAILWPMARLMADYVPGIHLSQTQMQAGVIGINTFRIYKPAKQLTDHDPECSFVKTWVPELADASVEQITRHEQTPVPGYIAPIADYASQTKLMRSALWEAKKSELGKKEASRVLEKHGSRLRGGRRR
jgi:deoxyribodipyrimidine photo-lyase